MKQDYQKTMYACFIGYIVQAIVNSFVPLLFVTFQNTYRIPLSQITLLITINFVVQLLVELLSAGFVDKIIFGRLNYSKEASSYKKSAQFYNECVQKVIEFCVSRNKAYHIKDGTFTHVKEHKNV